jgi:anti-sigma factor RsiW
MTCRTFIEFLMEYLDGELPPEERAVFDEHLAECPWCVAYLQNYRQTIRLEREALADDRAPVPGDAPEELVQAILAARPRAAGQ